MDACSRSASRTSAAALTSHSRARRSSASSAAMPPTGAVRIRSQNNFSLSRQEPSMDRSISLLFAASLLLAVVCGGAAAQGYPAKPVRIVVPAQPGGGLDLIGRTFADQLGRSMGQSFVVENISGGGGTIASQTVARAAPDGYTLMVGYVGTHGTNPAVRKVPYDAVRDFTAIAMVGGTPNVLVVQPSLPVVDIAGLIGFARKNAANYASGGIGTLNHLAMEQFRGAAGFEAVVVH